MKQKFKQRKKLWHGAIYLSVAAIIIKILSAIYRVPYQNIAGDVGFYVYQQIYPIYAIVISLSTFGFPVIISKLILEQKNESHAIVKSATYGLFMLSTFLFFILYFSATDLAFLMGDEQLVKPIKAISFIIFIIPLLSVFRGYFQGNEEMLPTATSQVFEQFFRVSAILITTYLVIENGLGPYAAGVGAALSSIFGGLIGFLLLFYFYRNSRPVRSKKAKVRFPIVKTIIISGFMICFSSMILIFFQVIDSVTILNMLVKSGVPLDEAKISKGIYDRGQPLIQMGTVITTSFSLIVVPLITKVRLEGNVQLVRKYSYTALKFSTLIGAAASLGLAVIIKPTNIMLFKDDADSIVLAVLGITIALAAVFLTTSAILHGLDKVKVTVLHVLLALIVKAIANIFFIPLYGTLGAAIATVIACGVCACFNVFYLQRKEVLPFISFVSTYKYLLVLMLMVISTYLWKFLLEASFVSDGRMQSFIIAITSAMVGAVSFFVFIVFGKLFSEWELDHFPKLRRAVELLDRKKKH